LFRLVFPSFDLVRWYVNRGPNMSIQIHHLYVIRTKGTVFLYPFSFLLVGVALLVRPKDSLNS
jgi:hypothetical protein